MPAIPIRGVGDIGIISDLLPYDIPINAWNSGRNVRFRNRTVSRSSVFKAIAYTLTMPAAPASVIDASVNGEQGCVVVPMIDGSITQLQNGTQTDVSPVVPWGAFSTRLTTTRLGGVTYMNNPDNIPLQRDNPATGRFAGLPGWDSTHRCVSMKSFKDYIIAMNVTKGASSFPNMVKWSDVTQAGAPPTNWDITNLASHAGENVINDARGKLIDGLSLGNTFILYGSEETYRMSFIGTPLIFSIEKLFDDLGVPGPDCAVEIDGKHYVFGVDKIYIHDGMSKISVSDSKVTERVFRNLDYSKRERCFVFHNPRHTEIVFCYPSISDEVQWNATQVTGCNEGAVYNYVTQTWSFIDLPSLVGSFQANLPLSTTWEDFATAEWRYRQKSWRSYEGSEPVLTLVMSSGHTGKSHAPELYFYDDFEDGYLPNEVDLRISWVGYVETAVKDADEMGATLASRKRVNSIHPQVLSSSDSTTIQVSVGVSPNPRSDIQWYPPQTFNPKTDYKCDFRANDRYVALRFDFPAEGDAEISGYDIDVSVVAQR